MNLEFAQPLWLWFLLFLPLLPFLKGRRGRRAAVLFSTTAIVKKVSQPIRSKVGRFLFFLRLLVLALLIVGLARPRLGKGEVRASGIDIVFALDISSSMLAVDFSVKGEALTRLDAAKKVMAEFIRRRPNDRMAMIAFARNSHWVSPLTLNHDWLLGHLERIQVGLIADGTAIGTAIGMGVNRLRDIPSKSRVLILLTDGINNAGKISPVAAAEAAASFHTKVYTIGIGGDKPAMVPAVGAKGEYLRDRRGQFIPAGVVNPVETKTLSQLATLTGARFFRATNLKELRMVYAEIDQLEKTEVQLKTYAKYHEAFIWPVFFALVLLVFEQGLAHTYWRKLP